MGKRKSIREAGALLALLSLWIQLVLGFGHIHAEELFGPGGLLAVRELGTGQVMARHDQHPGTAQDQSGAAGHGCALCAGMALLAAGALPDAARLLPPSGSSASLAPPAVRFILGRERFPAARSRAPPVPETV